MKKKKEKKIKPVIIILSVIVLVGIIFSVLYFTGIFNKHGRFPGNFQPGQMLNGSDMGNFQLNESQISDINSFFNRNPSASDVQNYCSTNRGYCFYYCRNLNPTSEICSSIMNFSRSGQPSGNPPQ
jgi:hypothetical protein